MATVLLEAAAVAVVDHVGDDLVLLVKFSLLGFEEVGPGFGFGDLLEEVGQAGDLDDSGYFSGLHVHHLVVEGGFLAGLRRTLL
jgi:hypothetical protein